LAIANCQLPIADLRQAKFVVGSSPAMNAEELKTRTRNFSLRVLRLVAALPENAQGRAIGSQLIRSGTSVGANYRAACRGRSRKEFVAKIGVAEEEADESAFWMELIIEAEILRKELVAPLLREAQELVAIMARSRISATRSLQNKNIGNRQSAIDNRQ
jgi:four helix bundle protein